MKIQDNSSKFRRCSFAPYGSRKRFAVVVLLAGWLAGTAYADNTCISGKARVVPTCGGGCTSAEVDVELTWVPFACLPDCTVFPSIQTVGLCASISTLRMHIVDPLDECGNDDVAPFPIDLLAGPFVLTNAQLQAALAGDYLVRAEMAASSVCENTEDPPGSGIKKVCATSADCDSGDTCIDMGKPTDPLEKFVCEHTPIPTLSEWGAAVLTVVLLCAGTIVFRRSPPDWP